eukprot:scaffold1706_cov116-Cylindrotheca_fusiformis.AAC.6
MLANSFGIFQLAGLLSIPIAFGFMPQLDSFLLSSSSKPTKQITLNVLEPWHFQDNAFLVAGETSVLPEVLGAGLLVAIGAFVYANVVYTPEILENSVEMRLQLREVQVQKLLTVVQTHIANGLDLEDLRRPLEDTFGTTIEEYVADVDAKRIEVTSADQSLAEVLKGVFR